MEILNPGNVLPFYTNILSQMKYRAGCKEFNWAIPVDKGSSLAFQIPVPKVTVGAFTWQLFTSDGVNLGSLDSSYLVYSEDENENAWITYKGFLPTLLTLDCGVYYFRLSRRGVQFGFSEEFRVVDIGFRENAYKIVFNHNTDIDNIIYQGGYSQTVWLLDAIFDTPEVVEAVENVTDGDAVEVLTFQSVQTRDVLRFPYFPDYWQNVFPRLRMMDNVLVTKMLTAQVFTISGQGIAFSTEDQDVCFKKGVLSWIASTQVMGGCGENKTLVYLDNVPQ